MALAVFSDIMSEFDQYLKVERNLSPSTRAAYRYDLQKFKEYLIRTLGSEPSVGRVNTQHIKDYLNHLQQERRHKSATLSRTIASLRVFFEYCVQQKHIEYSPAAYIHNPKLPRKLPIYLVESELRALLSAPELSDTWGVRDYAILVLLAFTGMRRQELVGLDLASIDFERRTAKVLGKGSKERLIPLNAIVIDALTAWLEVRPVTADPEPLFVNKFGKRLTGRGVYNIVKKHVRRAGIVKGRISPHKLRHTFATLLHLSEVDILEIQRLLGHASITSTQIYTHTNTQKLRSAVERLTRLAEKGAGGGS
ncbi:MAG: tyrosine recombinase XerC [Candidatus Sumerlaeaceae bacterium]|jgi:site-specific recombinase XerD